MRMRARMGVRAPAERTALVVAAQSGIALDRSLAADVELTVSIMRDEALVAGAFQRGRPLPHDWPLVRRGSGGPEVRVGPGTIHVELALVDPAVMLHPDPRRIVNRAVRPLLRALTRQGHSAHFFGRDWVSVAHRPAAWVGFAHDSTTRRALFEAFVAVTTPFAIAERPSFAGKQQGTLETIGGRGVDAARVAQAIVEAYADGCDASAIEPIADAEASRHAATGADDLRADPPWASTLDEAIGTLGAGPDARGIFRIGGDLLVSRDAVAHLESLVAAAAVDPSDDDIGRLVDEALGGSGVALDGVRSLASVRDVISRALPRSARL